MTSLVDLRLTASRKGDVGDGWECGRTDAERARWLVWGVLAGALASAFGLVGVAFSAVGAIVVSQRFGGTLNLNLHFHALVLDSVNASPESCTRPVFHPAEAS